MAVLTPAQRNALEKAVMQARKLAEAGAQNALQSLAVNEAEPFKHQTPEQRSLRNRLRTKGRLLGDDLPASGKQAINHLAYELSYEYWHKMLFAQFLEANGLLIHPLGVAVTIEECEELAKEEGHTNRWAAAAAYASKLLPAIFRVEDPLMQVEFAPNDRIALETILENLDHNIYKGDDALGWVYQFWQSEAKDAINASGDKIDGEKLPAVTQLFTEPYMVHFLIDNAIGAWWVGRHPGVTPPVKFEYLRLLDDGAPAAGRFEGWPGTTAEITTLDPCMGSGHFVVSLFLVLVRLRMFEEGLSKEVATDKVLEQNLFGLELDARCTQLAAFNLALTAWKFCGHYKQLPEMHLACSGIAPKGKKEDWVKLVGNVHRDDKVRMENGMRALYDHFQLAPELGSLLEPSTIKADAFTANFDELQPVLIKALANEVDKDLIERGVVAAGIAKAGEMLGRRYVLQITNVPYLARRKHDQVLSDFAEKNYPEAKSDLANMFLDRILRTSLAGGTVTVVIPQNWLFLTSYSKFRAKLLKNESWNLIAKLGPSAFSQISGEVVQVVLISINRLKPPLSNVISGLDVSMAPNSAMKDASLRSCQIILLEQNIQLANPDHRVVFETSSIKTILGDFVESASGQSSFDRPRFYFAFWELGHLESSIWIYTQGTSNNREKLFDGLMEVLRWEEGNGSLAQQMAAMKEGGYTSGIWRAGEQVWGSRGVLVSLMGDLIPCIYLGYAFDQNCSVIIPKHEHDLYAIASFVFSSQYHHDIRQIDQALKVTSATTIKCAFDKEFWERSIDPRFANGFPKPYSEDASQWLFHGHPTSAESPLQVFLARLLGYRWPAENDKDMELADQARELIDAIKHFDHLSNEDGIVCIPSVNGEPAAAEALRDYVRAVWVEEWRNQTIEGLLHREGSSKTNLEDWLRDEFFIQHCKVFQNRPFIWHIWDGRKDGFGALVNYHKFTKENLQKLIYTYLADWIRQCESRLKAGQSGADGQLNAAKKLKEKLEIILKGEAPYDIFVRWKKLEELPTGWEPDLNDGVRLNIRPFIIADVLRKRPNIKWGIDRGKNPPGSPWGEIRDNDKHLTLEEKRAARASNVKAKK